MNMLEQYIVEVHGIEAYTEEWTKQFEKEFVEVDVTINCYGSKERKKRVFAVEDWETYKAQGYWMG